MNSRQRSQSPTGASVPPDLGPAYAAVPPAVRQALLDFRQAHALRSVVVAQRRWEYLAAGQGPATLLLLHGMTGAADIWWQQIAALAPQFKVVAVTYPAAPTLGALAEGVLAVLQQEGVERFNLVGTSLGGYLAQYLVRQIPDRIERAVFSNAFPPNDRLAAQNGRLGAVLPYLPEAWIMAVLRRSFVNRIYPTSGADPLTLAYLLEIGSGRMSKAQVIARYRCVMERFVRPEPALPVLILEADNDPLVDAVLREQLKQAYPQAAVRTFHAAGHFVYINQPEAYTEALVRFLPSTPRVSTKEKRL